jgi:hypothetical protein
MTLIARLNSQKAELLRHVDRLIVTENEEQVRLFLAWNQELQILFAKSTYWTTLREEEDIIQNLGRTLELILKLQKAMDVEAEVDKKFAQDLFRCLKVHDTFLNFFEINLSDLYIKLCTYET